MNVFHSAEFGKQRYVHHTIGVYPGLKRATALSTDKADCVITQLLDTMEIWGKSDIM